MIRLRISPAIKITIAFVLLTLSILIVADVVGIVPNERDGVLEGRKKFCESLAIQVSMSASRDEFEFINVTLDTLVQRNPDVVSAALRNFNGEITAIAGDHGKHWIKLPRGRSTQTHVQVPIFKDEVQWGTVEVVFTPLSPKSFFDLMTKSFLGLLLFVAVCGFLFYLFFIKKVLRELDPSSVIPERVKSAFNALAEGLLILDEKEQIILANDAFAEKIKTSTERLIGKRASALPWNNDSKNGGKLLPWQRCLRDKKRQIAVSLKFQSDNHIRRTFVVNVAPIFDVKGRIRGTLATFDDMTDLEKKHNELQSTVGALYKSQEELLDKTLELELLATRDPLTGCLNRRAFLEKYEHQFASSRKQKRPLSCLMMDLDHFKSINDRFGHACGDKVLKYVSELLRQSSRPTDIIGRYGGEEFCIILPETDLDQAALIAERLRKDVHVQSVENVTPAARITTSIGVAALTADIANADDLIHRADIALYLAKDAGRNRVVRWQPEFAHRNELYDDVEQLESGNSRSDKSSDYPQENPERVPLTGDVVALRDRVKELEEELEFRRSAHQARNYDELTGLPDRFTFLDRMRQTLARSQRFGNIAALVYLDIDTFKRINDTLGEIAGNQMLKSVAERLSNVLRSVDTVGILGSEKNSATISRLSRDEFGILLTDLHNTESVTWIIKRIFDALSEKLEIDHHEIFIACSAGISLFPHDGSEPEFLLRAASAARTEAKNRHGRNNMQFFSSEINKIAYRQLWLEGQLHRAIEGNELVLHYQPTVDLETGQIRSMEALIRWNHPKLGFILPGEFIEVAEHTSVINRIGEWVLDKACRQLQEWDRMGFRDVKMAVNLSPAQFRNDDLANQINAILKETDIDADRLDLEITENTLIENFNRAVETMTELHEAGVSFAIDDFGTGYSSLSYLKTLPVDWVKIDRSFLSDVTPSPQDQGIISAIISMAHSLDLQVIAEGVETDAQRELLHRMRCDEIQGYLISRPVSADQATQLLRSYNLYQANMSVA